MGNKVQNTKDILSYWQTTSFFTQSNFTFHPYGAKVRAFKTNNIEFLCSIEKTNNSSVVLLDDVFVKIHDLLELYEKRLTKAKEEKKQNFEVNPLIGRITFEFGKVRRQCCIDKINELYNYENDSLEETKQKIVYFGFQLSNDGKYWDNSFSISPILWAIDAIENRKELNTDNYRKDKKYYETIFFDKDRIIKGNDYDQIEKMVASGFGIDKAKETDENTETNETIGTIEVITPKYIKYLHDEMYKKYVQPIIENENDYEQICKVSFTMYANRYEYEKASEQDYSLSMDFYSREIDMVKNALKNNDFICDYVCSNMEEQSNKFDVLNDLEKLKSNIADLTDLRNAPLGKWPSQYNLVFMQQLAVNIQSSQALNKQPIFSVNGPPGTGKTTLLKEVIVDNIISRAKVMSTYNDPDDLFERKYFLYGKTNRNAYSEVMPYWYSVNNPDINQYSVLITSNNNTAVENITKELPKLKQIVSVTDDQNAWISKEKYQEIADLFDPQKYVGEKEGSRDIYFNQIGNDYIKKEIKDECWGILAAPLGRKENVKNYYYGFLKPVIKKMRKKERSVSENYEASKKKFLDQYNKVLFLQEEINKPKILGAELSTEELETSIQHKQQEIENYDTRIKELEKELKLYDIQNLEKTNRDENATKIKLQKEIEVLKKRVNDLNAKNADLNVTLSEIKASITWIGKLFKTKEYKAAKEQENAIQNELTFNNDEITQKEKEINETTSQQKDCSAKIESLVNQIRIYHETTNEYTSSRQQLEEARNEFDELLKEKKIKDQEKIELEQEITKVKNVLDKQAEQLVSKDKTKNEEAHMNNLWITDDYDIERMKLFYYALEFNKEFVLSSYYLNKNLCVLESYWGFGNENIKYHPDDMKNFVKSLYQSLFLVTPVISTTFASVGRMFEFVQDRNAFGTLIIDEAGQAEPKMALGALYRCSKAMIVGDPNQIEPVINEDTNELCEGILKKFDEKVTLSASESVQSYADRLNEYGTVLKSTDGREDKWVGLPLVVHRRCNSPMFEISNTISYGGIMVKKTKQNSSYEGIYENSKWIEVYGNERGKKDHYVEKQGKKVVEMLKIAESKGNLDNVFVITPFKSVSNSLKNKVMNDELLKKYAKEYWDERIGTVHTFQGKEADEVIFVLGCDEKSIGAVKWVNSNIVNVAASRAKQRFYIIGAINVWTANKYVLQARNCLNLETFKKMMEVQNDAELSDLEKNERLRTLLNELPSMKQELNNKFSGNDDFDEEQNAFYENMIQLLIPETIITKDVLGKFGFSNIKDLDRFSEKTRLFLKNGLLIYSLLLIVFKQISKVSTVELDTSCCAIEFAKALESQAKETFISPIKEVLPDWEMKNGRKPLYAKDALDKDFTLGAIRTILEKNIKVQNPGDNFFGKSKEYKKQFIDCLKECTNIRNETAHSEPFTKDDFEKLRKYGFLPKADGKYNELKTGLLVEMLQIQKNVAKH